MRIGCLFLQGINQDSRNNDQIPGQRSLCDPFSKQQAGEQENKDIGEGIDDGTIFIGNLCIGIGIQEQHAEKDGIGGDDAPVQIFVNAAFVRGICTLL